MAKEKTTKQIDSIICQIKNKREEMGLTQLQLADKIGISRSTINRFENNKFSITIDLFLIICKALDFELKIIPNEKI